MSGAALLDAVKAVLDIESDRQLAFRLHMEPAYVSRVRNARERVNERLRVEVARATDWRMKYIDTLAGSKV
jgi:hypothetical protein